MTTMKDALRAFTASLRKSLRKALHRAEPAYFAAEDAALTPSEYARVLELQRTEFPSLVAYATMRLGADAPSERALADALERSARTIPADYIGDLSLVACPCTEVVRFVPFENAHDLVSRGWTVIESWYCSHWRAARWRAEAEQPPTPPAVAKPQEKITS